MASAHETCTTSFTGPLATRWASPGPDRLETLLRNPPGALNTPTADSHDHWSPQALDEVTLAHFRSLGTGFLGTAWPQVLAHDYARYHHDGDRVTYEAGVFGRAERLTVAAVLAAVTHSEIWLDEVVDGVVLLCEQSTWCWPAHDDTFARHGSVLPTVTDPYLDLGAGEVASQLAWIDHLLGDPLEAHTPGLRARIRHETWARVLDPFRTRRDWHWLGLDGNVHNWNPWIHGNVLVAALQLVADPAERAEIVALVIEGLDRYVASLPADGAIDEGFHYWWNGACRALEALEILSYATGGALDASDIPCLRQTVAFPHRMHLGGEWYVNHADGPARCGDQLPWRELHRAAVRAHDDDALALAASYRAPGLPLTIPAHGLGRVARALTDPLWSAARPDPHRPEAEPSSPPLPRDVWLPSTQVLVARSRPGSSAGLTLVIKGGHNDEHHNHNDVGSFIVAVNGVPALIDAGRPTYTAQTFGPDRYQIRTMQSSWHNVPEISGIAQGHGARFRARDVIAILGDSAGDPGSGDPGSGRAHLRDDSGLDLDIAGAYPLPQLRAWRRSARLHRATGKITIRDAWEFAPGSVTAGEPIELHLLCAGNVTATSGKATVQSSANGHTIIVRWPSELPGRLDDWKLDDPYLREQWGDHLTRLTIDVSHAAPADLTMTIEEAPL